MALNHLTTRAFPPFFQDYASKLLEFFQCWVDWMNKDGNSAFVIDHLSSEHDIDESVEAYKIHLKQVLLSEFPEDIAADLKLLLKNVFYLYNSKSSEEAYKFFFKAIYNEDAELSYPKEKILKPSDGRFNLPSYITCYNAKTLYSNITNYIGWMIVGKSSKAYAYIVGSSNHDFVIYKNDELYHKYESEEITIKLENDGVLSDDNQIIRYSYVKDEETGKNLFEEQYVCLDIYGKYIKGKNTSISGSKVIPLKYSYVNQNAIIIEDQHGTFIGNSTFDYSKNKFTSFEDGEKFYLLNPKNGKIVNFPNSYITTSDTARVQWNNFRNPAYEVPSTFNWNESYGLLDSDMVLQDNYKYQNYSYEIKTNVDSLRWKKAVKLLLHPAGFKLFSNTPISGSEEESLPIMWYNTTINAKNIVDSNIYYLPIKSETDDNYDIKLKDRNNTKLNVIPLYSHGKNYIKVSILNNDILIKTTDSQDDYTEVLMLIEKKIKGEDGYTNYSFSAIEYYYDDIEKQYIALKNKIESEDKIREYITSNFLVGFTVTYTDSDDKVVSTNYTEVEDNISSDDTNTITVRDYLYNNIFLSKEERTKRKVTNPSASYFDFIKKFFRIWFYMDEHDEELINLPERERNKLNLIGIASLYPYKKQYSYDNTNDEDKTGWISFLLKLFKLTQTHSETPSRWLYRGEYSELDDFGNYKVEDLNHIFNKNSVMLFNDEGVLINPYIVDWVNFEYTGNVETDNIRGFTLHTDSHLIYQKFNGNYFYPEYDEDYIDDNYFVFVTNTHVNDNHKIAQFILKTNYSTYTKFTRVEAETDSDGNIIKAEYNLLSETGNSGDEYEATSPDDKNKGRYYSLVTDKDSDGNLIPLDNYVGLTDLNYYAKKATNEYVTWAMLNKEDFIKTNTGLVTVYNENSFLKIPEDEVENGKRYKNYKTYIKIEVDSKSGISDIFDQDSFISKYCNYIILGNESGTSGYFLKLLKYKFSGEDEKSDAFEVNIIGDFDFNDDETATIYDQTNGRFSEVYSCVIKKYEKDLLDPSTEEIKTYDFNSRYYTYSENALVYSHKSYDFQNRIYIKRNYDRISVTEQKYKWNDSIDLDVKDIDDVLLNENLYKNTFYDDKFINIDDSYIKVEKEDDDSYYLNLSNIEKTYIKSTNVYKESNNGNYIKIKCKIDDNNEYDYFKTEFYYNEIEKQRAYKEVDVEIIDDGIRFIYDRDFITYTETAQSSVYNESDTGNYVQLKNGYYKFIIVTVNNTEYISIPVIDISEIDNNSIKIVSLLNQDDNKVSRIFYRKMNNVANDIEYYAEDYDGTYVYDAYIEFDSSIKKYYFNENTNSYEDYISGNTIYINLYKSNENIYVIADIVYKDDKQYYKISCDNIDKQYTLIEEEYNISDTLSNGNYIKCDNDYVLYSTKESYDTDLKQIINYCVINKDYVANLYSKKYIIKSTETGEEVDDTDIDYYVYKSKRNNFSKFYDYYTTEKGQVNNFTVRLPRMVSKDELLVFVDGLFTDNYEVKNKKYTQNGEDIYIPVLIIDTLNVEDLNNGSLTINDSSKKITDTFSNDIVNISLADQIEIKETNSDTELVTYFDKEKLKIGTTKLSSLYFNNDIYTISDIVSSNPYLECEIYITSQSNPSRVMEENKSEHYYMKIDSEDFNTNENGEVGIKYIKISSDKFEEISGNDDSSNGNYLKINDGLYPFITKQKTEYSNGTYVYKNYMYVNMEDFHDVDFYGTDSDGNRIKRTDNTINRTEYTKETMNDEEIVEYIDDELFTVDISST